MTDYKSMFEQAVRTLAAIDEELGIGDDGCGDPYQTLTAIAELKDAALRGESLARTVMAMTTPETFFEAIGSAAARDGFLNRFLIVESDIFRVVWQS